MPPVISPARRRRGKSATLGWVRMIAPSACAAAICSQVLMTSSMQWPCKPMTAILLATQGHAAIVCTTIGAYCRTRCRLQSGLHVLHGPCFSITVSTRLDTCFHAFALAITQCIQSQVQPSRADQMMCMMPPWQIKNRSASCESIQALIKLHDVRCWADVHVVVARS